MLNSLRKKNTQTGPLRSSRPDKAFFHGLLIVILCLVAYSNTFHVPFQFDDPTNITDNSFVRNISFHRFGDFLTQVRSFTYLTFALNYRLYGAQVAGYHIVNLMIHLINGLLVYVLATLIFRTPALKQSLPTSRAGVIALFSALLFVSHPVQTQAVTYIVQRMASLATLFFLVSTIAYIRSRLVQEEHRSRAAQWAWYGVSLAAAVLAMKSKETAFTLPIVIALSEFLFFTGNVKRRLLLLLPLFLTIVIIPMTMLEASKSLGDMVGDLSKATRLETDLPRAHYLFTELAVLVTYLRLLLFPVNQNLDYDYPVYQSFFEPHVILSFLLLASLFGTALYVLYRDRRSPSTRRVVSFGLLWFFITLSVESSIIPIADVIFEHRLYLPSVGFFLSAVTVLFRGAEKLKVRWAESERLLAALLVAAVVVFTGMTYARNIVWRSEVSLWQDVIKKSPMKARGYNGLGLAYLNMHDYDRAVEAFAKAIALDPVYGTAFNNIGSAFYLAGLYDRAIESQTEAIALQPNNAVFRDNRGISFAAVNEYDRAIEDYTKAIAIDPSYAKSYHNIGLVFHRRGLYPQAIEQYTKAIMLDPGNDVFPVNRGLAYAETGEQDRAIGDFTHALFLNPHNVSAYSGRGEMYTRLRRYDEAVADFTQGLSFDPAEARLYVLRGIALEQAGRPADALADFELACSKGNDAGCKEIKRLKR